MDPDDIPTSVTKMTYSMTQNLSTAGLPVLSQNDTAKFLAHYWPAIAEHFARLLLDANPDRSPDFSAGVDWAADTIRNQT